MKKYLKIIGSNVLIFAFLLILLNGLAWFALSMDLFDNPNEYPYSAVNRYKLLNNDHDDEYNRLVMQEFYQLETRYQPFTVWTRMPFKGKTTTINEIGDRVHPIDKIPEDSARIVRFFGGSTMWGTGSDDNGTIPAIYNKFNPEDKVYNHGESGFTSRQNLARLINILNQNEGIDVVIFYDGFNDIETLCRAEVPVNSHDRAEQINAYINTAKQSTRRRVIFMKALESLFIGYIKEAIIAKNLNNTKTDTDEHLYKCCTDTAVLEIVANTLVNNWRLANDLVNARGGKFVAILQPSAYLGKPIFYERYILGNKCSMAKHEQIYQKIRDQLADEHWFHDFTQAYDYKGPLYIDGCHVSEKGNAIIAEKTSKILNQ